MSLSFTLCILGVIFVGFWIIFTYRASYLKKVCTKKANGIIVDNFDGINDPVPSDSGHSYYPVIEYSTPNKTYRVRSSFGDINPHRIGKKVTLFYSPDNPQKDWYLDKDSRGFTEKYVVTIFLAIGILLLSLSLITN